MSMPTTKRPVTADDYERLIEVGVLEEDSRVELLEGVIVPMTPVGSRHAATVDRLARSFHRAVEDRAIVRVQSPVRLGDRSEPEPDVALLVPRADFYADAHPRAEDLFLVVEVSESSRDRDALHKAPLYARHGVAELWIVDLATRSVRVHREPGVEGYRSVEERPAGGSLSLHAVPHLDGVEIAVRSILP